MQVQQIVAQQKTIFKNIERIAIIKPKNKLLNKTLNSVNTTNNEIESLLPDALAVVNSNKTNKYIERNAVALLENVEQKLNLTFKDKIFEKLKKGFQKTRTAVININNNQLKTNIMLTITKKIVVLIMLLISMLTQAQKKEIQTIEQRIEHVVKTHKKAMKKEIEAINTQLDAKKITSENAIVEKKIIAIKYATKIQDEVSQIKNQNDVVAVKVEVDDVKIVIGRNNIPTKVLLLLLLSSKKQHRT